MSRNKKEEGFRSPYVPDFKNVEEALEFAKKGIFHVQDRIGEIVEQQFKKMRLKIHKVLDHENPLDELDYDVYVTSILVDCRALFLESNWRKTNGTLQNLYISRGFEHLAENINNKLVNKKVDDKKLGEIIKNWVDKRVVHFDYLDEESEERHFEDILAILRRDTVENIFIELLVIADEYECFKQTYGDTASEQMDRVFAALTGD